MEYVLHIFVARDHMQLQHSTLPIARTNRHNRPFSLYLNNAELSCRRAAAIDDTGHVTREFMGLKVCRGDLSTNTLTTTRRSWFFFSFLMCESVWNSILKGSREAVNIFKFEQQPRFWWRTFNFRLASYIYFKAPTVFGITSRTCQHHLPAVMTLWVLYSCLSRFTLPSLSAVLCELPGSSECVRLVFVFFFFLNLKLKIKVECVCVWQRKKDLFRLKQQQTGGGGGEPCLCSWDA